VKALIVILAAALVACGGTSSSTSTAPYRPACPDGVWNGTACVPYGAGASTVKLGKSALKEGQLDEALRKFKMAIDQGPHAYETIVHLYEQLGIASAYRDDEAGALLAFGRLLLIAPGHLLSYQLSPTATDKFEEARRSSAASPNPTLAVTWPDDLDVARPIPIEIEVVADPAKMLTAATLYVRDPSQKKTPAKAVDVVLAPRGQRTAITLPALGGDTARRLSLNLVARDRSNSEVLLWASSEQPRTLRVGYTPPTPLWKKPWPYITGGSVLVVGVSALVYVLVRPPPDTVDGGGTLPSLR